MKARALALLSTAIILALSLWFVSAAILPEMMKEAAIAPWRQAGLTTAVQVGFVCGALVSAIFGVADRFDPRRVFALAALFGAAANLVMLAAPIGGDMAIAARFATGAALACIYPVGMKIAVGWGIKDRGRIVGLIIGALTFGTAAPYVIAFAGGAEWRATVIAASAAAALAAVVVSGVGLGPWHVRAARFDPATIAMAWTNRGVRLAYAGYFGHMWELYAMWGWATSLLLAAFAADLGEAAKPAALLTAFAAIMAGGVACIAAGLVADRVGKARVAMVALAASALAGLATAFAFDGPAWLLGLIFIVWGAAIVPDSAQFSALVADYAPPEVAGSLMTLQTALGFALTFVTVQGAPLLADWAGWRVTLAVLAIGPALGFLAMRRLDRMELGSAS